MKGCSGDGLNGQSPPLFVSLEWGQKINGGGGMSCERANAVVRQLQNCSTHFA
jgi:hypothetical protein